MDELLDAMLDWDLEGLEVDTKSAEIVPDWTPGTVLVWGLPPAVGCLLWRVIVPKGPVRLRMAGVAEAICEVDADNVLAAEDLYLLVVE